LSSEEEARGMRGLIGGWFEFETLRGQMETELRDLELSSFAKRFGARNEVAFRQKLKELRILLDKIFELIGPAKEGTSTVVS